MDQAKALALLNRQLLDIVASAERIVKGANTPENLESFSRYSEELKQFISDHIQQEELLTAANNIPTLRYQRYRVQLWEYLILPVWWLMLYRDIQQRKQALEEVNHIRGQYASLQLLTQGLLD